MDRWVKSGFPSSKTSFAQLPALAVDFLEPGRVDQWNGSLKECPGMPRDAVDAMAHFFFEICDCP